MTQDSLLEEVEKRLRGYERKNYNYTEARYGLRSMRYYANLRSAYINGIIKHRYKEHQDLIVLDIGCGTGVLIKDLLKLNDKCHYVGLDFSDQMLNNAVLNTNEKTHVTLIRGSAFELPFKDNTFDAVVCTRFIHQYTDRVKKQLVAEFKRVLKPEGIAIIEFYSIGPWILRYPLKFRKAKRKDYFSHCVSGKRLENILASRFLRIPLMLPFHTAIIKLTNFSFFKRINDLAVRLRLLFMFEQFLVVVTKS